jgi:uncharacterized membrane protein YfbV (UPF0208 family)
MNIANTMRYIDVLQLLVQIYNHTIHSTIKQKPMYVHLCDWKQRSCKQVNEQVYNQLKIHWPPDPSSNDVTTLPFS